MSCPLQLPVSSIRFRFMDKLLPMPSANLLALSEEYFSFLARALPVCCLSDEFHFMPRVESAWLHREETDRLDREFLEEAFARVKGWRVELKKLAGNEDPCLGGLLAQSMAAFLVHWETLELWRRDPGLYLKVAFIGLDQALSWPLEDAAERSSLYRARLDAIPRLLAWGTDQLEEVPEPAMEAALEMVGTCRDFLSRVAIIREKDPGLSGRELPRCERAAFEAVERFEAFLRGLECPETFTPGTDSFREILDGGYGCKGGIDELRDILAREASDKERALQQLAGAIDMNKGWQAIYNETGLPEKAYHETVSLYSEEVGRLEAFFGRQGMLPMPPEGSVRVEPTPSYLKPIRATASYSAPPFLDDRVRQGCFFVQVFGEEGSSAEGRKRLESVHREYRYLSAHETYPGHHLLDWFRLCQPDPIRRRIESALFYEGWACYAEQLVDEFDYDPEPRQRLIRIKRDLWRAVRGRLDLELHVGAISLEQGAARLEALGYAPQDAKKQARRITLTPGYQLCYTLGKHRFLDLRRRHVPPLSLSNFHDVVLRSGQAPFSCLDQALDASTPGNG